tara:strand:+ start:791 stop:1132 length:342 start_codon:yes stop_codon:yes gene_type:complete
MPKPLKPTETRGYLEPNPEENPTNRKPVLKGSVEINAEQVAILKEMTALGKEPRLNLAFWNNQKEDGTKYMGGKAEAWLSDKDRAEAKQIMSGSTPQVQMQPIPDMGQDDIPF